MEVVTKKRMMIFSGSSYPELSREVADHLGMRVGEVKLSQFANGELYARFAESVRGPTPSCCSRTSRCPAG
jgi:ribose-phosphate pyrophosphokinase